MEITIARSLWICAVVLAVGMTIAGGAQGSHQQPPIDPTDELPLRGKNLAAMDAAPVHLASAIAGPESGGHRFWFPTISRQEG